MPPFLESFGKTYGVGPAWVLASLLIFLRYALPAALVFYVAYRLKRLDWWPWKIQQKFPKGSQIRAEILYSLMSSFIFGSMALAVFFLRKAGYGAMYFEIGQHGWGYWAFSILAMIFAHDTYFYWAHRLMHHPRLFKTLHLVHHQSVNPTPFTAFSFHPLESLLEFGIVPLIALLLPVHPSALFLFTLWSIVFNILGHSGYEFSPSGFTRHRLFKWINTPTHHNLHHTKSACNYGLYFNFWDRLMGTNDPDYDKIFESIKMRKRAQTQSNQQNMKTIIKTSLLLLLFSAFAACKKEALEDVKDNLAVLKAQAQSEQTLAAIIEIVQEEISQSPVLNSGLNGQPIGQCPTVTVSANGFPASLKIDFGSGCSTRKGYVISGVIQGTVSGKTDAAGAVINISLENFVADGVKASGQIQLTTTGANGEAQQNLAFQVSNFVITNSENMSVTLASLNGARIQAEGQSTTPKSNGPTALLDDVFEISFDGNGSDAEGKSFTLSTPTLLRREYDCRYIVSGEIAYKAGLSTKSANYGDGACDNVVVVTVAGVSKTVTLP